MTIELTDEEMQVLNMALGLAIGTALNLDMKTLARNTLALCNTVNRSNPNYKPYGIETQENPDAARN